MKDKQKAKASGYETCLASTTIAWPSPSTLRDLLGVLVLPFEVTNDIIWGLIQVGGIGLLAINKVLMAISIQFTHRFLEIHP